MMKVIYNSLILYRSYKCINLLGILFVREGKAMSLIDFNHDALHAAQMKELLYLPFYLLYVLEWLCRLILLRNGRKAYLAISHEQEVYDNQGNTDYLTERKPYYQFKRLWH